MNTSESESLELNNSTLAGESSNQNNCTTSTICKVIQQEVHLTLSNTNSAVETQDISEAKNVDQKPGNVRGQTREDLNQIFNSPELLNEFKNALSVQLIINKLRLLLEDNNIITDFNVANAHLKALEEVFDLSILKRFESEFAVICNEEQCIDQGRTLEQIDLLITIAEKIGYLVSPLANIWLSELEGKKMMPKMKREFDEGIRTLTKTSQQSLFWNGKRCSLFSWNRDGQQVVCFRIRKMNGRGFFQSTISFPKMSLGV